MVASRLPATAPSRSRAARPFDPLALPFDRWRFTLRLTRAIRCHFGHGAVAGGVIRAALGMHELPPGIIPAACEMGHVRFARGDLYRIGVTLVGAARAIVAMLETGLERLARETGAGPGGRPALLAGNFRIEAVERIAAPPLADLLGRLEPLGSIALRFVSPFRLKRPSEQDEARAKFLNEHCFPAGHFLRALAGRVAGLAGAAGVRVPDPGRVVAHPGHLLWLDTPVADRLEAGGGRAGAPRGYTHGGVLGTVRFDGLTARWMPWLLAGRYVHAGEHPSFAMGRYVIEECEAHDPEPFVPAATMWDRAIAPQALAAAAARLDEGAPGSGDEEETAGVADLAAALAGGTYRPGRLQGRLLEKADGGCRALAVPPMRDRIAQRAVADVLAPALDTLLEDCSHGYRRGRSRAGAAEAIRRAWDEGYRWVLDADITAFFDSVGWARLFAKVRALYPFDPVTAAVEAWVRAPVVFAGREVERTQGLPQGMPLSPLLANLFLDEFDEALLDQNFRLVRYADDFVVVCRDRAAAEAARDEARTALARMGLALHEEKTAIQSLDDGFAYLGYLFRRATVTERSARAPAAVSAPPPLIPAASWLAQVPLARVRALHPGRPMDSPADPGIARPAFTPRDTAEARRPVYVSRHTTRLFLRNGGLVVERAGHDPVRWPVAHVSQVTIVGRARATLPLLFALGREGVPVYLCSPGGELQSVIEPFAPSWQAWFGQARVAEDAARCLAFSRRIVRAKLRNHAAVATRFRLADASGSSPAAALRALAERAAGAGDMDELRGYEGRGASLYFAAMQASLPPDWGFGGRRRNPPPDPVNSMLSLGYTLLYNHASTALYAAGLNPRIGLFHRGQGTHHALASDLMEPFRHLIDRLVWSLVHRREASPADFVRPETGRGCLLSDEFRSRFIEAVDARLHTVFTPPGGPAQNYRQYLDAQARQVRAFIEGTVDAFAPYEEHA